MNFKFKIIIKASRRIGMGGIVRLIKHFYLCFDSNFYRKSSDSSFFTSRFLKKILPRTHYLLIGQFNGLSPTIYFRVEDYIQNQFQNRLHGYLPFLQYLIRSCGSNPTTFWDQHYLKLVPEAKGYEYSLLLHFKLHYDKNTNNMPLEKNKYNFVKSIEEAKFNKIFCINTIVPSNVSELIGELSIEISNCCKTVIPPRNFIEEFKNLTLKVTKDLHKNCSSSDINVYLKSDLCVKIEAHKPLILNVDQIATILGFKISNFGKILKIRVLLDQNSSRKSYINFADSKNFESFQMPPINQALSRNLIDQSNLRIINKLKRINTPKRILLISHEDSFTGAPIYLKQLANELLGMDFSIHVVSLRSNFQNGLFSTLGSMHSYLKEYLRFNFRFNDLMNNWLLNRMGEIALSRAILKFNPDLIIVNSLAACDAVRVATICEIPSILYVHESWKINLDYPNHKNDFGWRIIEALEASNLVIFGSEYSKKLWESTGISINSLSIPSVRRIQIPTESEIFELRKSKRLELGFSITEIVFLSVATFEPRKRIEDIVSAFKSFDRTDIRLLLIGSNEVDDPGKITELINGDLRITQLKSVPDLNPYYALADCLIFASFEETMPLVIQEAALWRIPRIVSKYPGYMELISDEKFAYLFTPKNSIELTEKMQSFLNKSIDLNEMVNISFESQTSKGNSSTHKLNIAIDNISNFQTSIVPEWWHNGKS